MGPDHQEFEMKKLILVAALAASAAVPALAQVVVVEPEVREYVIREGRASSIEYEGDVVVGRVLAPEVEFYEIEGRPDYRYTVLNDRRVIVEPESRRIIDVLD
jgi:hypothetical protein